MPRYSRKVVEKRRGEAITKRFAFQANAITNTTEKLITTKIQVFLSENDIVNPVKLVALYFDLRFFLLKAK